MTSALAVPAALTGFLVTGAGGHRPWFPTPRASQEALGRASLDRLRRRMESSP